MTRDESKLLKGVAILMMLFLHLFNRTENLECCTPFFYVGDRPLLVYLMRLVNPVPLYLILSGYGLYYVYQMGDSQRWNRMLKLLINYWIITGLFVLMGHFLKPDVYPKSYTDIITNILTVSTTYNHECWFLFPFLLLSATSPFLFKIFDNINKYIVIAFGFLLEVLCLYVISRYGIKYLYNNIWIYKPFQYFQLMFPFIVGALAAKYNLLHRYSYRNNLFLGG